MIDEADRREIAEWIANKENRFTSLYKIKDKDGKVITITPNITQQKLLDNCHKRNVIPKARQHGITTGVCIFKILDECLFNDHYKAAIIAHRENDALKIFASKIIFPYMNIKESLKRQCFVPNATRVTTSMIEFDNGSIITADTMVRSDTLQVLHISELSKMQQQFPAKAEEVKTGAIPAAERGQIFIESTMEGRYGLMPELCEEAIALEREGRKLTSKDFKFFFFPWFDNPEYALYEQYPIPARMRVYFDKLKSELGIDLSEEQKRWYTAEEKIQKDKMPQEYPSTYEEAIAVTSDSYYYQGLMNEARQQGRITSVPVNINLQTYVSWDLGYHDSTAIWIAQTQGIFVRLVAYFESNNEGLATYVNWLKRFQEKNNVTFEYNFVPHDAKVHELSTGISRVDKLRELGIKCTVLERLPISDGIELVRDMLPNCYFDAEACEVGIKMLDGYRKDVTSDGFVSNVPKPKQKASHCNDSLRYMSTGLKKYGKSSGRQTKDEILERSKYYRK